MPNQPDNTDDRDDVSEEAPQSERSDGIPGSRAGERDFSDVDPRTLDSQQADHVRVDPDEWFKEAFPPGTDDLVEWLEESDFLDDHYGPSDPDVDDLRSRGLHFDVALAEDLARERRALIHTARTDPAAWWESIGPVNRFNLQTVYIAWIFGGTDEERERSRRQRDTDARDAAEATSDTRMTMPPAGGEAVGGAEDPADADPEPGDARMPNDTDGDLPDGDPPEPNLDHWIDQWNDQHPELPNPDQLDDLPDPVVDQLADVVVTSYGTDPSPPLDNPEEEPPPPKPAARWAPALAASLASSSEAEPLRQRRS